MVKNPHNLQVGQVVWFEPNDKRSRGHEMTVEHIGRLWAATKDRYRIELTTLEVDGGPYSSPGRVWLSRDECEAETALDARWRKLYARFAYSGRPRGLNDALLTALEASFAEDDN